MIMAISGPHKVVLIIRVTMRMRAGDHQSVKHDIIGRLPRCADNHQSDDDGNESQDGVRNT